MADKSTALFALYRDRRQAETGIGALRSAGFGNTDVSALVPEIVGTAAGAASGGAVDGAVGWLAGIGALAVPGLGSFITAGPIMGTLAAAGARGLIGALAGLGIPEYDASHYEGKVREGNVLISVQCGDPELVERAREALIATGAQYLSSAGDAQAGRHGALAG